VYLVIAWNCAVIEGNSSGMIFPLRRMSTRKQAEKTGSEGKLLTKLNVNSYKVPKGLYLTFVHVGGCRKGDKEEAWNRLIASGEPKSISELNTLLKPSNGLTRAQKRPTRPGPSPANVEPNPAQPNKGKPGLTQPTQRTHWAEHRRSGVTRINLNILILNNCDTE